jgi:hypothetical protein
MASRLVLIPVFPSITVSAAENFRGKDSREIPSRIDLDERFLENAFVEKNAAPATAAVLLKNSRRCMGPPLRRLEARSHQSAGRLSQSD